MTLHPELLIADEPTTALDVNVQRVILQELLDIRKELGLTIVYVSHDMAVHAELADRMGIMYAGVMMEVGATVSIIKDPLHPLYAGIDPLHPSTSANRASAWKAFPAWRPARSRGRKAAVSIRAAHLPKTCVNASSHAWWK